MDVTLLDGVDIEAFVASATPEEIEAVYEYMEAVNNYKKYNKHLFFSPLGWQKGLFEKGATTEVRGVLACNRAGKSYAGTFETALHLTGLYPEWWTGMRYDHPIDALVLGYDFNQMARPEAILELLFGDAEDRGTGFIPKEAIYKVINKVGFKDVPAKVLVKHYDKYGKEDGISSVSIASYESGDGSFQGAIFHWILIDEQPRDDRILPQALTRQWSLKGKGRTLCVFTPERGLTETAASFWDTKGLYHSGLINISLYDLHDLYSEQELETIISKIPPWQAEFRIYGRPSAGAGAVFAGILKPTITYPEMPNPPAHWKRLAACDIGFQDDFVVMFGAEDPDTGELWVYDEMTFRQTDAVIIANAVKAKQQGYIPLMMPQDAKFERGLGTTFQKIFKDAGCIVCNDLAANWRLQPDGKNKSIAPGIMFLRDLMQKTLFKITPTASLFMKEFELYSYGDDGRFKDKHNHAIDCSRYLTQALKMFGVSELDAKKGKASEVSREEWMDFREEYQGY